MFAAALLVPAGPLAAAPVRIGDDPAVDVSADGRYVLLDSGTVLDRSTGKPLAHSATADAIDLARAAPKALIASDGKLTVRDLTVGASSDAAANVGPDGTPVMALADSATLVQDGRTVIFQTATAPKRIIARDLEAGSSTVLLEDAALQDASEDGRVITWSRALAPQLRPFGTPLASDPPGGVTGLAVGYVIDGGAARIVSRSEWEQRLWTASGDNVCANGSATASGWYRNDPTALQVSQDGAAGRYAFLLQTISSADSSPPYTRQHWQRVGAGEPLTLFDNNYQRTVWSIRSDPESGAFRYSQTWHGPSYNAAAIVADDGTKREIIPSATGGHGPWQTTSSLVFGRGTGFLTYGGSFGPSVTPALFVDDDLGPVGPSTTPWTTLPRGADLVFDEYTGQARVKWALCAEPGRWSDYAGVVAPMTRNSAGIVWFTQAPGTRIPAKTLQIQVKWLGIRLWSRTVEYGPVTLPSILPFVPGYTASLRVTLADGATVSGSVPLWRSR